jgi:RND family efflux transporter MFP subunit
VTINMTAAASGAYRVGIGGILILVIALAFVATAGQLHAQGGPPAPPSVTVAKPVVKEILEWDEFIGRFEAVDQVDIRARVSGYIDRIHFKDGSIVKMGDALFTIDQRPYRLAVEQADTAVTSAQSRLDFASSDLQRAESLSRTGNITEQLLDQRRQNFQTARAELDRSRAALAQARLELEFTEIKAPIAGRVSRRLVSIGNLVNANETVLTNIVSLDPIHFYFDVDERSYLAYSRMADGGTRPSGRDNPNEVFVATTDEREPKRPGHMDFVDNRLDPATGTMRGRAVFENKDMWLTPGLFGRIRIMGSGTYKGVLVPDEAIASDQDRRVVFVVNSDNTVAAKPVRPGPRIDGYRVVREGLTGAETIVINGLVRVRAGGRITPQPTTLAPVRERNGS